jgi:hypothetical protein
VDAGHGEPDGLLKDDAAPTRPQNRDKSRMQSLKILVKHY